MRWQQARAAALVAAFCWGAAGTQAAAAKSIKDLSREAEFVFRGTIVKPGAANLSIVEPDAKTAVVRVDEVLKAADTLDDFTGREVTVFLRGRAMKAGEQQVFFTKVGLIGESLGVQEVGRRLGRATDTKARLAAVERQIVAENLATRLKAADLAISGRVLSVRATYSGPESGVMAEHDPQWWEAVFEIKAVLQGQVLEATLPVWFPSSRDVMWAAVPKPFQGHEGTWLLHRHQTETGRSIYAILDAQDLLSAGEVKILEKMVKP